MSTEEATNQATEATEERGGGHKRGHKGHGGAQGRPRWSAEDAVDGTRAPSMRQAGAGDRPDSRCYAL